jgi:hypothetical protein
MSETKPRMTLEDAGRLYPDEWIVFVDPRIDPATTEFMDGVIHFHSKDPDLAFKKCGEVAGDTAIEFTGELKYRKVTLSTDAADTSTPKAA